MTFVNIVDLSGSGLVTNGCIRWLDLLSANFGVKMVMVTTSKVVRASDVKSAGPQPAPFTETALLTLGEIAASSDSVEGEVSISVAISSG